MRLSRSGRSLAGRPGPYILLFIILTGLAVGEWKRSDAARRLASERDGLLELRQRMLSLERDVLLARTQEIAALSSRRSSLYQLWQRDFFTLSERLEQARTDLDDKIGIEHGSTLSTMLDKYARSVFAALDLSVRIGMGTSDAGLIVELQEIENRLTGGASDNRETREKLLQLQVLQREYVTTLRTSQAEELSARVEEMARRAEPSRAEDLRAYGRQVEKVLSTALELELQRSEASVRFDRLPPVFRHIEMRLDTELEETAAAIAEARRRTAWNVALFLALSLLVFAFRARSEQRRTRAMELGIRQLVDGMDGLAMGRDVDPQQLPRRGDLGKVAKSFRDMSRQIRRQLKTIDAERLRAEDAARAKADFLARVSHELRTPLQGVLGMAEMLDKSSLTSEQHHLVSVVRHSGDLLLSMVDDLLDYERLQAGKLTLEKKPFDPMSLFEDIVATHAPPCHRKGLELVLSLPDDMPPQLIGDRLRLTQVLTNLIGNAQKFTERGHVEVRLQPLRSTDDGLRLSFTVRDTGPGIPAHLEQEMFKPFAQGESVESSHHGGSGLGLSIVRELVELMDGEIRLGLPDPGEGAVFEVELRVRDAVATEDPVPESLDGFLIRLVDPHPRSREQTARRIRALGAEVDSVESTDGLLSIGTETTRRPDLVIVGYPADRDAPEPLDVARQLAAEGFPSFHLLPTNPWGLAARTRFEHQARRLEASAVPLRRPALGSELRRHLVFALTGESPTGRSGELPIRIADADPGPLLPFRILLVEDNLINQQVVELMLLEFGCRLTAVENGREAVERVVAEEPFDLILMDCQMPVMDGFAATEAIRALDDHDKATVPIVALTAEALSRERSRCLEVGMDDVVSKPADQRTLLETLQRFLVDKPDAT